MDHLPLAEWRDFYTMIGTASGVIVGAAFIVASLASGLKERAIGLRGFVSPIAVHLGSVLIGSAVLAVPTLTRTALAYLLAAGGGAGVVYGTIVAARIWSMNLDHADRTFYALLPIAIYGAIASTAYLIFQQMELALEVLATAMILLLIVGMRNAWDMASFMITRERSE